MPHYPVRQPDGKLAIYSTIVDAFTMYDCDTPEAVNEMLNWHMDTDPPTLYGMVSDIKFGQDPKRVCKHWQGWDECLAWSAYMHGWDDESVQVFINMTPVESRERIRGMVASYQAEAAKED